MPPEDPDAATKLRRDFESYLKGGEPSSPELACAPLLESWRTTVLRFSRERDPWPTVLVLLGRVTGHPQLYDTATIRTSPLIWLDRNRRWARTWNRVYRLGTRTTEEASTST